MAKARARKVKRGVKRRGAAKRGSVRSAKLKGRKVRRSKAPRTKARKRGAAGVMQSIVDAVAEARALRSRLTERDSFEDR
jgi:hypothetical protein